MVDHKWHIQTINKEAKRILGLSEKEIDHGDVSDVFHIYESFGSSASLNLNDIKFHVEENRSYLGSRAWVFPTKSRKLAVTYSISPLQFSNQTGFKGAILMLKDITEYVNLEQHLRQSVNEANKANQIKSMFLANMSHEIRTPMNGILGMLQLLKESVLSSTQLEKVELALTSGLNLLNVINDILDFSKLEADKIALNLRDFNI